MSIITYPYVCQEFFINVNDFYGIKDDLSYEEKGFSTLVFDSINVLDEKGEMVHLEALTDYFDLDGWRAFKKQIQERFAAVEKYVGIFLDRAKNVASHDMDEKEAKEYWDESDEDSWPRDSYDAFEDWYESNGYYDWLNDEKQFIWDDFKNENEDIYNAIDSDLYIDSYDNVFTRTLDRKFEDAQKFLTERIKEIDDDINKNIENRKYDAILYIFGDDL